jgi:hypothetical protein
MPGSKAPRSGATTLTDGPSAPKRRVSTAGRMSRRAYPHPDPITALFVEGRVLRELARRLLHAGLSAQGAEMLVGARRLHAEGLARVAARLRMPA